MNALFFVGWSLCFTGMTFEGNGGSRIPAGSTDQPNSANYGKANQNFTSGVGKYLEFVPHRGLRQALQDYVTEVSNIHGGANESIEVANNQMLKNDQCFSELALQFYSKMQVLDFQTLAGYFRDLKTSGSMDSARLNMSLGKAPFANVRPGSVWDLAMDISGNDGNIAMALIGLCGHDNAIAQKPEVSDQKLVGKYRDRFIWAQKKKLSILASLIKDPEIQIAIEGDMARIDASAAIKIPCDSTSAMYVPKSLGEKVDIPDSLKNQIARVQAPKDGAVTLRAKYYHVLAGARIGCQMKQKTGLSFVGAVLDSTASKIYRAIRLNDRYTEDNSPRADAAKLWRKWYQPVEIPGIGKVWLPVDGVRPDRNPNLSSRQWMNPHPNLRKMDSCQEPTWTEARCKKALAMMDTWEIDFKWTSEQHWVGARFGEKMCEKFKPGETLETRSCATLRKQRLVTPNLGPSTKQSATQ